MSPIYPEIPPSFWEQYSLWIVLGGVLVLLSLIFLIWRLTRPAQASVVPIEILTRQELQALLPREEDGQILSQVSRCLRRYLMGAFGLSNDEMTTTEFCKAIAQSEIIGPDLGPKLTSFLKHGDELKFSPAIVPSENNYVQQALNLVEESERRRALLRTAAATRPPVHS